MGLVGQAVPHRHMRKPGDVLHHGLVETAALDAVKRDSVYDASRDEYTCPAGQVAVRRFTTVESGKTGFDARVRQGTDKVRH